MSKVTVNVAGAVGAIAGAITELTKAIAKWAGTSSMRRLMKCVRNADLIARRIRDMEIDDKVLNKLLEKHEKYNN